MPPFGVGADGAIFHLSAYVNSRTDLTREFEQRMPAMITFVNDWLRIHKPGKMNRCALTAKSYFLQEAEGISPMECVLCLFVFWQVFWQVFCGLASHRFSQFGSV